MNILKSTYTGAIKPQPLSAKFTNAGQSEWVPFERLRLAVNNTDAPDHVWQAYLDVLDIFG